MNLQEFEKSIKELLPKDTIRDIRSLYQSKKPIKLENFTQIILNF